MSARILVIALDSYDKDLLLSWAAAGHLPTLANLLQCSTWAVTEGPPAVYGGAVWPSFNTGVSPAHHRRFFRRQAPRGEYIDVAFNPSQIQGAQFWEDLSAAGRRVAVLDAPHAKLSRDLNGIQLVDWATHEPELEQASTCPASLRSEIVSRFGCEPSDPCEQTPQTAEGYRALLDHLLTRIRNKTALSNHYLTCEWDFFITVFAEAHCAGHQWWHLHDKSHGRHDPALAAATGDLLKEVYIALDRAVAEVAAAAGPETTTIVFCSHGMGPLYGESVVLDEILRRLETPVAQSQGSLFSGLKQRWYALPLTIRNSPAARFLKSRAQTVLQRSLLIPERHTRRFYAIPHNPHAGAIRINLVGREAHGLVQPGDEYRRLCDTLRQELLHLTHLETGERAVDEVYIVDQIYDGPFTDELPDLLVQWRRQGPVTAIASPRIGTLSIPALGGRTGDHTRDGIFLATGPDLGAERIGRRVSILDFAPTFLAMLDAAPQRRFDGAVIPELCRSNTAAGVVASDRCLPG